MALSDHVKNPQPLPIHGRTCSVGELLAALPEPEAEALNVMLTGTPQRRWSQTEIYDAVTAEGHVVGRQSINRHRAGRCRCFPSAA
jgi:hypothetical protein